MRLEQYINEDKFIDQYVSILQDECKPFLSLIKNTNYIYRGVNHAKVMPVKNFMHSEGRIPLSTPKVIHDALNNIFKKKFGWPCRDGVFCSYHQSGIGVYGKPYYVFGIGDFEYCYSEKIYDLWTDMTHWTTKKDLMDYEHFDFKFSDYVESVYTSIQPEHKEYLQKFVNKYYKNSGLGEIRNEISFRFPNGYYLIDTMISGEYKEKIDKLVKES
jgi:hypothetical protein